MNQSSESIAVAADRESFTSEKGFAFGKVNKRDREKWYRQSRLPGTGAVNG